MMLSPLCLIDHQIGLGRFDQHIKPVFVRLQTEARRSHAARGQLVIVSHVERA